MPNEETKKDKVGRLTNDSMSTLKNSLVLISKKKIKGIYGLAIVVFVAGLMAASILIVATNNQQKSRAATGSALLSWTANTESDLAGYKLYYGTSARTGTQAPGGYTSNVDVGKVTTYTLSNLTEGQKYYFSLVAYDTSQNVSPFSNEVSKLIPVTADVTPPTVSITSPANNANVLGTINITANASDAVGVAKVEFYVDSSMKSSDTSSPYSYSLDTTSLNDGAHQLVAKAYDAANNVGTSPTITINVNNATPVTCTSFTYSAWSTCINGTQTRTVTSSSPTGCTGGNPILTQSCTPSGTTCTSFTYSKWSACVNGTRTRTVTASTPAGCSGGTPVISQTCKGGGKKP